MDIVGASAEPARAFALEDIYFQASTRGGRAVDKILHGKAEFKANTGTIGNVLANGSMALSDYSGASDAVAVAGGVAGVFLIVSSNAKPEADVRYWSSLPDTVHVLTLATKGKAPVLTARFLKDGVPVAGLEKPVRCEIDSYRHQLCLVRAH